MKPSLHRNWLLADNLGLRGILGACPRHSKVIGIRYTNYLKPLFISGIIPLLLFC